MLAPRCEESKRGRAGGVRDLVTHIDPNLTFDFSEEVHPRHYGDQVSIAQPIGDVSFRRNNLLPMCPEQTQCVMVAREGIEALLKGL